MPNSEQTRDRSDLNDNIVQKSTVHDWSPTEKKLVKERGRISLDYFVRDKSTRERFFQKCLEKFNSSKYKELKKEFLEEGEIQYTSYNDQQTRHENIYVPMGNSPNTRHFWNK